MFAQCLVNSVSLLLLSQEFGVKKSQEELQTKQNENSQNQILTAQLPVYSTD